MKARDAFGVIVRTAGFGCVLVGLLGLVSVAVEALGLPVGATRPAGHVLTLAGIWMLMGLVVLAGASRIVSLIYGRDAE